jgi:integrase
MTSSRHAAGESTIHQDAAGRWHGYVSMGLKAGGVRDRRHVSGRRRADVVTKLRDLEKKREAGSAGTAGRSPTVSHWLDHWLTTIAARKVRPSTLEGYESKLRTRIKPALGHHRLDGLQPEHVEAFYAELEAEGLSSGTVLQCHRILSRALKVAMQRGRVARNVCTLVDSPSLDRAEVNPLTTPEVRQLLEAAKTARNSARWSVPLALGLRQGEALGLPWDAIDFERGTLTVRQALQRQRGKGLVIVGPKSRAGRRAISLPKPLADALRAHRVTQLEERMAAGSCWEDSGLVFCQLNGRPIDPSADNAAWKALLKTAGVRDARLHDYADVGTTTTPGTPPRQSFCSKGFRPGWPCRSSATARSA